jgi:hypothetical protein
LGAHSRANTRGPVSFSRSAGMGHGTTVSRRGGKAGPVPGSSLRASQNVNTLKPLAGPSLNDTPGTRISGGLKGTLP